MITKIGRILKYTKQHIVRNGWLSFASISIMTLTFFVITIFALTLYSVNIILHYYESKSQVIVFFNPSEPISYINSVKSDIKKENGVTNIKYVSKQGAYERFVKFLKTENPSLARSVDVNALPPSLEISTKNLTTLENVANMLFKLKKKNNSAIDNILYFKSVVKFLKQSVSVIRDIGLGLIIFLGIISFIIIIITIAITINSHSEEIEIMRLVGASNNYISGPFIIEGAFYGVVGVIISFVILAGLFFVINTYYQQSILYPMEQFFQGVPLPTYSLLLFFEVLGAEVIIGIILGSLASFVSLRRYLK